MSEAEFMLGYHCGVTFAGLKPASLFWMKDEQIAASEECRKRFAQKNFRFAALRRSEGKSLLYVFQSERLKEVLFDENNRVFLRSCGYEYADVGEAVAQLRRRICSGGRFPHEIGVFLGYPLEDVCGFIKNEGGGVCFSGCWKAYGESEKKAKLFDRYKKCSECVCRKIMQGKPLAAIFKLI